MPPANGADSHRIRAVAPFLQQNGWEAEILAVDPKHLTAPLDDWLCGSLSEHIPIHRVHAIPLRFGWIPGLGSIDLRAYASIRRFGDKLLSENRFDLVYFSTTAFTLTALGPRWFKKYKTPFVVDYQDPWITDFYKRNALRPPGGHVKYAISQFMGKCLEKKVIRFCSGITAVSEEFPAQLKSRYTEACNTPVWIAPFPAVSADFERVSNDGQANSIFDPKDGFCHWVYVGVITEGMHRALRGFFHALKVACARGEISPNNVRIHFVGTSYAPAGTAAKQAIPIAAEFDVDHLVDELTDRVAYSQALRCLRDANSLLLFGSDEPAYAASKLMPYLLIQKPLLAVLRDGCAADIRLRSVQGASAVRYDSKDDLKSLSQKIQDNWFASNKFCQSVSRLESAFSMYTDKEQAKSLANFFDTVVTTLPAMVNGQQ